MLPGLGGNLRGGDLKSPIELGINPIAGREAIN
jgi:hypothetical protein